MFGQVASALGGTVGAFVAGLRDRDTLTPARSKIRAMLRWLGSSAALSCRASTAWSFFGPHRACDRRSSRIRRTASPDALKGEL